MRILHVALGLPPLRTGGLTRYCVDVMDAQMRSGIEVGLLFPGKSRRRGGASISESKRDALKLFELVNSLPVALNFGVGDPFPFMEPTDPSIYDELLATWKPDIIHVHSIMGIHREFFYAARDHRIPLIFTTHDYYPICIRCTFINKEGVVCDGPTAEKCAWCNYGSGITNYKSKVMQSRMYERLKATSVGKRAIGYAKRKIKDDKRSYDELTIPSQIEEGYKQLLSYYHDIMGCMDLLLCNSKQTQEIYSTYYPAIPTKTLLISHGGIEVIPHPKKTCDQTIVLGYMGGMEDHKGFKILMQALSHLNHYALEWELRLFGSGYSHVPQDSRIRVMGAYDPDNIDAVFSGIDVTLVPSIWPETFGFVVLESLAAGVPVICSDKVGAKDLVPSEMIIPANDPRALADAIVAFDHLHCPSKDGSFPVSSFKVHMEELTKVYSAFL